MAEKKKTRKIVSASSGKEVKAGSQKKVTYKQAAPKGNATGLRIGAVILWVLALAFEVVALLILFGKINMTFMPMIWQVIIAIVLDLGCLIAGSLMWKKANDYDPASEKNKLKFWLWNNLGLIVAVLAFVPLIILTLTNKNADKKTKTIVTAVAAVALLIGGLISYDWNPTSQEDLEHYQNYIEGDVYWTAGGAKFHTHDDCYHINDKDLTTGSVEEAWAANKNDPCKTCLKADGIPVYGEEAEPQETEDEESKEGTETTPAA